MHECALVLHTYESGYLALLDRRMGRVDCWPQRAHKKQQPLARGSLIRYTPNVERKRCLATNIDLLDVPFELARIDLFFFHHVLELCFLCIPVGALSCDTFQLLLTLYRPRGWAELKASKNMFLFQLFDRLGLHPESEQFHDLNFHSLAAAPIDVLLKEKIDLKTHQYVTAWLRDCIKTHPMIDSCKTSAFLDDVRAK